MADDLLHGSTGRAARDELDAVIAAGAGGAVAFAIALATMWGTTQPIAGDRIYADASVGQLAAFTTGGAAAVSFVVSRMRFLRRTSTAREGRAAPRLERSVRVLSVVALAIVCFALGYIGALTTASVFQSGFVGLELDAIGGAIACGLAAAAAGYVAHPLGNDVSTRSIGTLVPMFLAVGVIFSMLTASHEHWWQLHFSELGAGGGISGLAFNGTLIVSGLLVASMGAHVRHDLHRIAAAGSRDRERWVGHLLGIVGGLMLLVGIVRVDVAEWLHIVFASGMVAVFAVLCLLLPRLAPHLPKAVHVVSIAAVIGIVVELVLWWPVGYYNFTAFELAAAGIIFVWPSVFVRALAAATDDLDSTRHPEGGKVGA